MNINLSKILKLTEKVLGFFNKQRLQAQNTYQKLSGFDHLDILSQWVSLKFPNEHIILLMNIDVQAKNIYFWAKIPKVDSKHFLKDIVVLRCKDLSEMQRLLVNLPKEFAEAYAYERGQIIDSNTEGRQW